MEFVAPKRAWVWRLFCSVFFVVFLIFMIWRLFWTEVFFFCSFFLYLNIVVSGWIEANGFDQRMTTNLPMFELVVWLCCYCVFFLGMGLTMSLSAFCLQLNRRTDLYSCSPLFDTENRVLSSLLTCLCNDSPGRDYDDVDVHLNFLSSISQLFILDNAFVYIYDACKKFM